MENVNINEKANINDEQLEDVSGGVPGLVGSGQCYICGNHVLKINLVEHHLHKVCRSCLEKINNR